MVRMISIVGAVYALIGVLGYSMFKSDIKGKKVILNMKVSRLRTYWSTQPNLIHFEMFKWKKVGGNLG